MVTLSEKHNCTECRRIHDHEAMKGFHTSDK